jgi:putative oxidoreductase
MKLGIHILRITVGALFVGHGSQKLFGWFGGHGPDGTGQFFEMLGLRPGKHQAIAAGTAEAGGGLLLAAGGKAPIGEAALSGVLITAIRTAHSGKGPWVTDGGFEYPLVLLAGLYAIAEERYGTAWAVTQLAAGAAAAVAVEQYSQRQAAPPATGDAQSADAAIEDSDRAADAATAATAPAGAAAPQEVR